LIYFLKSWRYTKGTKHPFIFFISLFLWKTP
jgi:hypothetical protein